MLLTKPTHNTDKTWNDYIQWTDETGQIESVIMGSVAVFDLPPQASTSGTYTFKAAASQPIYYDVAFGDEHSEYSLDCHSRAASIAHGFRV
jgi:hypothetical protein